MEGLALAPVEPFRALQLEPWRTVTLTYAELAARMPGTLAGRSSGEVGGLAGVLATASTTTTTECSGPRTFPAFGRLFAHKSRCIVLQAGDALTLTAPKKGTVTLRPLVRLSEEVSVEDRWRRCFGHDGRDGSPPAEEATR